jgi:sister-chromatid-cohesion protein PDS5
VSWGIGIIADKLLDPEEKIRAMLCKTLGNLKFEVLVRTVSQESLVEMLTRCKDKKRSVRTEAFEAAVTMFHAALPKMQAFLV